MKNISILLFALCLLVAGVRTADACSVFPGPEPTTSDRYANSETVFVGTVHSVTRENFLSGDYRIQFNVSKVYKGDFDRAVVVTAASDSAACGYDNAPEIFKKGTAWVIYADGNLQTSGVSGNTEYETTAEAQAKLDSVVPKSVACTKEYKPVCGRKDTGIRCVTTPCPSTEDKTYGNSCMLAADKAGLLYEGECRQEDAGTVTSEPNTDPATTSDGEAVIDVPTPEEIGSAWQRFWEGLKRALFFWKK